MYQTAGHRRRGEPFGGLDRSVEVENPTTHARCQAEERRIRPILEPALDLLVRVAGPFLRHPHAHVRLHHAAYAAYRRLKRAAEAAGVPPGLLTIVSGYRSVATQRFLWERALSRYGSPASARIYVAPPNSSPHHTGRAIDFYLGVANDSTNIPVLRSTPAYRWLVCHAARFGFTPYTAEPWHWEFNPLGLNPSAPSTGNGNGYRVAAIPGGRPTPRAQFGYVADGARPAHPPKKATGAPTPVTADWTIAHTAYRRFTLVFPKRMEESGVLKLLFLDGRLPPGFTLQRDPTGKGGRWGLVIPSGVGALSQNDKFTKKLADALGQAAMDNIVALSPPEAAVAHERMRQYNEAVSKRFLPFLGTTFGEALKTHDLGWFEEGGHFVWIGVTTNGTELQATPLSKSESVNRDMRWYLKRGMSIKQAQQELFDRGVENLRMLVVGMMGA